MICPIIYVEIRVEIRSNRQLAISDRQKKITIGI